MSRSFGNSSKCLKPDSDQASLCLGHMDIVSLFLGCLPNIQTSLAVVNLLKFMLSGAIHLIGSLPLLAWKKVWFKEIELYIPKYIGYICKH